MFIEGLYFRLRLSHFIAFIQRLYFLISLSFNWRLLVFFFEVNSIQFLQKIVGLISAKGFFLIFVLILPFEVVLFLSDNGDEVIEVLVEIDSFRIV